MSPALGSAIAGGLDQLDQASGRLRIAIEMLRRAGHVVGQLRRALLPTPFHPQQDQTHNAGCNDQDHNHCDDDGGHEHPFQTVDVKRNGEGTVLQVVQPQLLCVRCRWNSSRAHSLPSEDHDVAIEMPFLALDFITSGDGLGLPQPRGDHG